MNSLLLLEERHFSMRMYSLALLLAAVACQDAISPPTPQPAPMAGFGSTLGPNTSQTPPASRFGLDSIFVTHGPAGLVLTAVIRAKSASPGAIVRFALPDLELDSLYDAHAIPARGDFALRNTLLRRVTLRASEASRFICHLGPIPDGYYRVVVSVFGDSAASDGASGAAASQIHFGSWLFVAGGMAQFTDVFDPAMIPEGMRVRPGRFRPQAIGHGTATGSIAPRASATVSPGPRRMLWYDYSNSQSPVARALAGVPVLFEEFDEYENQGYATAPTYTDADGYFSSPCAPNQNFTIRGQADLRGGGVNMWDYVATTFREYYGECDADLAPYVADRSDLAYSFEEMRQIVSASRSRFPARGDVLLRVRPIGYAGGRYLKEGDWYETSTLYADLIEIDASVVYGAEGSFVKAHEYGHAVLHRALGGYAATTCNSRSFTSLENFHCTWVEGFATFHGVVTREVESGRYGTMVRNRGDDANTVPAGVAGRQELQIASFLYDLVDPALDEPHDAVQVPYQYLTSIIMSCRSFADQVSSNSASPGVNANGVVDRLLCMEQQIDNSRFESDFGVHYAWFTENVAEPPDLCRGRVRALWEWNLANVSVVPVCG